MSNQPTIADVYTAIARIQTEIDLYGCTEEWNRELRILIAEIRDAICSDFKVTQEEAKKLDKKIELLPNAASKLRNLLTFVENTPGR